MDSGRSGARFVLSPAEQSCYIATSRYATPRPSYSPVRPDDLKLWANRSVPKLCGKYGIMRKGMNCAIGCKLHEKLRDRVIVFFWGGGGAESIQYRRIPLNKIVALAMCPLSIEVWESAQVQSWAGHVSPPSWPSACGRGQKWGGTVKWPAPAITNIITNSLEHNIFIMISQVKTLSPHSANAWIRGWGAG